MRKFLIVLLAVLTSDFLNAQAPQRFSYQAVIRDASNALLLNQTVGTRISILQGNPDGGAVYAEYHNSSTNQNGLLSLQIGDGDLISGAMGAINWAAGPYYIKCETDPSGGTNYSITSITQLLSVPYALYAESSGSSSGSSNSHYVGEYFGGGVVFHVWKDALGVEHGLIVDLYELSSAQPWSNVSSTLIGPSAQSEWDGLSNSNAIVSQEGHTSSAASLCMNSTNGGQDDWYLPSLVEVVELWDNRLAVNRTLSSLPGSLQIPSNQFYQWTSSEYDESSAYLLFTYNGTVEYGVYNKTDPAVVRAIRAF
jgi:hypothetical protein